MKRGGRALAWRLLLLAIGCPTLAACAVADRAAPSTLRPGECRCGSVIHGPRYCRYRFKPECEFGGPGPGVRVPTAGLAAPAERPSALASR
jgi:hypothetical protein